jgi:hypothetical protein
MKAKQIEINGSELTISVKKTPLVIRIILSIVLSIMVFIPILATYFVLTDGDGFHIGLAFSFLFFWVLGFYILRIILWNSFGREIIVLGREKIQYTADYKYFKDGRKEIEINQLATEIIFEDEPNDPVGRLRLHSDSNSIESVIKTRLVELEELEKEIKTLYNNG